MDFDLAHEGILSPEGKSVEAFAELASAMGIDAPLPATGRAIKVGRVKTGEALRQHTSAKGMPDVLRSQLSQTQRAVQGGARFLKTSGRPNPTASIPDDYVPGSSPPVDADDGLDDLARPKNYGKQAELKAQALLRKAAAAGEPQAIAQPDPDDSAWQDYFEAPAQVVPEPRPLDQSPLAQKTAVDAIARARSLLEGNPIQIGRILIENYRQHWLEWEPETLWSELTAWGNFVPPRQLKDKILSLRLILSGDRFFTEWPIFENIVIALNNRTPIPGTTQHVSPEEIARGVSWANAIQRRDYGAEVLGYIAAVCFEEGLLCLPEPLEQAQPYLDRLLKDKSMCPALQQYWASVKNKINPRDLQEIDLSKTDHPMAVQFARMASVFVAGRHPDLKLHAA